MEEFGIGSFDIIRGLSPLLGIAGTGRICGAVSGGIITLGLYFGRDELTNYAANGAAIRAARIFVARFEETFGSLECRDIQTLILGRYFDPKYTKENPDAFAKAKGLEKCTVVGGIGARLAAEVIVEDMERISPT